jgi:hypothetical protein
LDQVILFAHESGDVRWCSVKFGEVSALLWLPGVATHEPWSCSEIFVPIASPNHTLWGAWQCEGILKCLISLVTKIPGVVSAEPQGKADLSLRRCAWRALVVHIAIDCSDRYTQIPWIGPPRRLWFEQKRIGVAEEKEQWKGAGRGNISHVIPVSKQSMFGSSVADKLHSENFTLDMQRADLWPETGSFTSVSVVVSQTVPTWAR